VGGRHADGVLELRGKGRADMTCQRIEGFGVVCFRRQRPARCSVGGCRRPHTRLCDFRMIGGATCDAKLCERHTHAQGGDRDFCPTHHRNRRGEQLGLDGPVRTTAWWKVQGEVSPGGGGSI
jgi:hypothetical protein